MATKRPATKERPATPHAQTSAPLVRHEVVSETVAPEGPLQGATPNHRTWCELNNPDPKKRHCNCSPDGKGYANEARRRARMIATENRPLTDDELDQLQAVYRERIDRSGQGEPTGIFEVMLRLVWELKERRAAAAGKPAPSHE